MTVMFVDNLLKMRLKTVLQLTNIETEFTHIAKC